MQLMTYIYAAKPAIVSFVAAPCTQLRVQYNRQAFMGSVRHVKHN